MKILCSFGNTLGVFFIAPVCVPWLQRIKIFLHSKNLAAWFKSEFGQSPFLLRRRLCNPSWSNQMVVYYIIITAIVIINATSTDTTITITDYHHNHPHNHHQQHHHQHTEENAQKGRRTFLVQPNICPLPFLAHGQAHSAIRLTYHRLCTQSFNCPASDVQLPKPLKGKYSGNNLVSISFQKGFVPKLTSEEEWRHLQLSFLQKGNQDYYSSASISLKLRHLFLALLY